MRKINGLLLLFSMLVSGCRSLPFSLVSKPTPIPLALNPCTVSGVKAECGTLSVPEDRNNPNGRILDLKIVVVRARDPKPQPDPLFYIAGGPGGVATTYVDSVNSVFQEINAQRDIVFLDQRGTNDKHRLTCEYPDFQIADAAQQQVDDWMKKCLEGLSGDPRFYTTVPAMQDLDDARAALGYGKINLYGGSYGSKAVQAYVRMFPRHARAAVAEHGNALDLPLYPTFPRAAQAALDQLFLYCEQDENCHAAYPGMPGDWKVVMNRLSRGPVTTNYTPPDGSQPISVRKADFESGVYQLLYEGNYSQIPFVIHTLATNEDWTPVVMSLSEHLGSGDAEPFLFMKHMIDCFEPAEVFGKVGNDPLDTASFYYDAFLYDAQFWQKICTALPKPDSSLIYGPGKSIPFSMLLFNSRLDPIFPPSSMEPALKEFTKSQIVAEPTEGHYTSNSYCHWHIIAQYIEQGSTDGLDTSCLENIKPYFITGD
jgi:pimeloyl-ACP methyl ester carboxylesterase